jgi:hypothetical protein
MRTEIEAEKEEMSEQELQEQRQRIDGEGGAA